MSWPQVKSEVSDYPVTVPVHTESMIYNSSYASNGFSAAEVFGRLDGHSGDDNELTYTTLESVKLMPGTERADVTTPPPIDNSEQPIDLSLTRQIDLSELSHYGDQSQVSKDHL